MRILTDRLEDKTMKANHRRTAKQNARKLDKMINHMYHVTPLGDPLGDPKGSRDERKGNSQKRSK